MASKPVQLIAEYIEPQHIKPLTEAKASGGKDYYIEGIFIQCDIKNRNQRIYPLELMKRIIDKYQQESVATRRAVGELGHPATPNLNPDRLSHIIESITQDGKNFLGRAKILDTPNGRIVKSLIDEKVTFGVSSRGAGNLRFTPQGFMVDDDFVMTTAADIVIDPRAPDAFVEAMVEGRQWVLSEGVYIPVEKMEKIQTDVVKAAQTATGTKRKTLFMEAWTEFVKELTVTKSNH